MPMRAIVGLRPSIILNIPFTAASSFEIGLLLLPPAKMLIAFSFQRRLLYPPPQLTTFRQALYWRMRGATSTR